MLRALKWLLVAVVLIFIALLVLGSLINANKSPEKRAAATSEPTRQDQKIATVHNPSESTTLRHESTEEPSESVLKRLTATASDVWRFELNDSPFDGQISEATHTFISDQYASEIEVQVRCVQKAKKLTITFTSHVYDNDGNSLPSSAFANTLEMSGRSIAVNGRVKWAAQEPTALVIPLPQFNNEAILLNDPSLALIIPNYVALPQANAFSKLLPAVIELSNGAGPLTMQIPANSRSINNVLMACQ